MKSDLNTASREKELKEIEEIRGYILTNTFYGKYRSDNVEQLITESMMSAVNSINADTNIVVLFGDMGSGKTILAEYIKNKYNNFELLDDFEWNTSKMQLEKVAGIEHMIIVSSKLEHIHKDILDKTDILICTSDKDTKLIKDRLRYVADKEGIDISDEEIDKIVDRRYQDIRWALEDLQRYSKGDAA